MQSANQASLQRFDLGRGKGTMIEEIRMEYVSLLMSHTRIFEACHSTIINIELRTALDSYHDA
jgi:hypothetical protein